MPSGQSVRVTYAHKRRRVQNASKKLLSSPLELLPPDRDDLTCTQMARRMLKRSRRVALAEQLQDKNVEHFREHFAKRIKRSQERVSGHEFAESPLDVSLQDDSLFQTPFSSQSVHEPIVAKPSHPEQLSPVPVAKRVMSRTSSKNLKENSTRPQILASPFSSRPSSAAPSPKSKGKGRSSRRVSRTSLHAKSRTLSGVFKENTRRVSRKDSTVSLEDTNGEPSGRRIKHQRYPSSPSAAYMRSRFPQEDWISPPKVFSRAFKDYDAIPSPSGSVQSNASFYADQPQSCSTPATSRLRIPPDLHGRQARADNVLGSSLCHDDSPGVVGSDIEMDETALPRRRTVHLSGNSIFSSSDEFTIRSLPAAHDDGTTNDVASRNRVPTRVSRQVRAHREVVDMSHVGHSLAGSFVAEYAVPLSDLDRSATSTVATKHAPDSVPKSPIGEQLLGFPGTSPAHGDNLVIRAARNPGAQSSVGEQLLDLPGTSPGRGESLVIRTSRNPGTGTRTPPPSTSDTNAPCPSSPASNLAMEVQSMDIRGEPDTRSDRQSPHSSVSIPLQARSRSVQGVPMEPNMKKSVRRQPVRNRAGTIRASDFAKPGAATGMTLPNARRTRSGTVVGPESTLAVKDAKLPTQSAKRAPPTRLAAVPSGSESESDDELLLEGFWTEGLEYLGRAIPSGRQEAEADELNLGGVWHSFQSSPARRPGSRKRR